MLGMPRLNRERHRVCVRGVVSKGTKAVVVPTHARTHAHRPSDKKPKPAHYKESDDWNHFWGGA